MHRLLITVFILLLTAGAASAGKPQTAPAVGLVNLSAANLRSEPAQSAELATQATYGTPVTILKEQGSWLLVELPDGYLAWAERDVIVPMATEEMERWRDSQRLIVTSINETHMIADSTAGFVPDNIVTDLVLGCILEGGEPEPGATFAGAMLPDGRLGYVLSSEVEPLDRWAEQVYDPQMILSTVYSLMGVPYLWGGTTTKGVDCSGLVKVAFFAGALILPRNASQQARCGIAVDYHSPSLFEPADLLFFSPEDQPESNRITHVAIYDNDSMYVHSSGRVRVNCFNPDGNHYLDRPVKRAVRIALPGRELPGAVRVADHPSYFNLL